MKILKSFPLILSLFIGLSPLTVVAEKLSQPQLQSPAIKSVLEAGAKPTFDWDDVPKANTYRLQVSVTNSFTTSEDGQTCSDCVINEKTTQSQFTVTQPLETKNYFWRVRAGHTDDTIKLEASDWSNVNYFSVPLPTPQLSSPTQWEVLKNYLPKFEWSSIAQANTYRIQVASTAEFKTSSDGKTCDNCVINEAIEQTEFQAINTLVAGTYFWRVRAGHTTDKNLHSSHWTDVGIFSTPNNAPKMQSGSVISKQPDFVYNGELVTFKTT